MYLEKNTLTLNASIPVKFNVHTFITVALFQTKNLFKHINT